MNKQEKNSLKKAKRARMNKQVMMVMLVASIAVAGLMGFNIVHIGFKKAAGGAEVVEKDRSTLKNDQYVIGNNPTDFQQEEFKKLTTALKDEDKLKISEAVVRCFISDYFTWTNKDGNYEVGGLQYIYGPMYTSFQEQSRWEFYKDLDLYISQYGRENLLEVNDITTTVDYASPFEHYSGESYESFYVTATWNYKPSTEIDVDSFQKTGYFTVVNNNGRFEIAEFYDKYD